MTADISVRVVDRGGQAVVGAHIVVDSGVRIGQSDVDGGLVFRQLALGEHVISATRIGYAPARVPVEVDGNDNHVLIVMLPIARVLDSVRIVERSVGLAWSVVLLDQFRQPVTGAQVGAIGTAETTQTDSAGHGRIVMRKPGSVVIRARKIGYAPVIVSLRLLGPRIDTLLMRRLATSLTPAEVMDRSGFGRDTFVYRDMDARLRWRGAGAGVVTRDELVPLGRMSLCDALPYTPTGTQAGLNPGGSWCGNQCILIDGSRPGIWPLTAIFADQVETVEYLPPGSDWSGSIAVRCGFSGASARGSTRPSRTAGAFVVWLRAGVQINR